MGSGLALLLDPGWVILPGPQCPPLSSRKFHPTVLFLPDCATYSYRLIEPRLVMSF